MENDNPDRKADDSSKNPVQVRMKKGDYRLHVYFEQSRSLLPPQGEELSDPVFTVTAFKQTKSTKSFSDVGVSSILPIGEHIFIDGRGKVPEEVKSERIFIEVRDHNKLLKDQPLGSFEFDMGFVYNSPGHAILHKWVVLSLPNDEKFFEPKGYLKVGISVTHEEDQAVDLCQDDPRYRDESCILPAFIKPKLEQIVVQVIKAESLPIMDVGGTLDIYAIISISGYECRTTVINADKGTLSAMWCEEIFIPCLVPSVSNNLRLTFMDYDVLDKDDFIGSIELPYDQLKEGKYKDFFWRNIYGAPPMSDSPAAELMNKVPELASHWRGRVLLRAWIDSKAQNIQKKCLKIKEKNFEEQIVNTFETGDWYEIRAQLLNLSALPFRSGKYKVKIEWSGIESTSSEKSTENGSIDWYEVIKRKTTQIPQGAIELMPDVIVYLLQGDDKICFLRIPASECFDKDKTPQWRNFQVEKHVNKVKDIWNAGLIKIKVYIGKFVEGAPEADWKIVKKPDTQDWILYAHVFQCRDLYPADKNGLADPYFKIYCAGSELDTKQEHCEMTLNPKWYKSYALPINTFQIAKEAPPILLSMFDHDPYDEDDFMGMCQVSMRKVEVDPESAPKPKWLKLTMGDSNTSFGEILVSFNLYSKVEMRRKYKIMPQFTDKTIDINVLGMRGLKPAVGWLPVNKAFVRFDLNSLELPGSALTAKSLDTQPFEEGSDPNILTTISTKCKMPSDPLFASYFTVTVHDSVFNGATQPLIGSFSIDLGRYFYPDSGVRKLAQALASQTQVIDFRGMLKKLADNKTLTDKKSKPQNDNLISHEKLSFPEVCIDANRLYVKPVFKVNEKDIAKEINIPDPSCYMPIGYNRNCEDGKKHYRYKLNGVLESTHIFFHLPFEEFPIYRAVFEENSASVNPEAPTRLEVGKLKANIRTRNFPAEDVHDDFEKITKQLLVKRKCTVRVYILDAFEIEQKDTDSLSDPYVRLKLGDKIISDKNNHQEDVTDPKIFKVFDIYTTMPGNSILKVQMWDFNKFTSDTKIGTTRIDLENRYFNREWQDLPHKPIETRPLYLKSCRRPQGFIRLWVEIIEDGVVVDPIDISLKPPMNYEARLIIWKSEDVPAADAQDPGDLYVRAKVNQLDEKRTDTHYKVEKGRACWNWRLKFNVLLPNRLENVVNLQIWDKDFLSGNDFISECSMSFQKEALDVYDDNVVVTMPNRGTKPVEAEFQALNAFWLECKDKAGAFGGHLLVSFEIVPEHIAKVRKVGEGRDEPNVSPMLPKPVGRFKFSYNPITLLGQVVGPEMNKKVCCFICLGVIVMLIIVLVPIFLATGASKAAFG